LRESGWMNTPPETALDDLTLLAAHICATPIAMITLVDAERQWFKSRVGIAVVETPRLVAFCAHTITQRDLFVVPDACADARFASNPLVTAEPHIRFYAGAPLITHDGHALGTICVIDHVPRELTPDQQLALRVLARHVATQCDLRRAIGELKAARDQLERDVAERTKQLSASETRLRTIIESEPECVKLLAADGTLLEMNPAGLEMLGAASVEQVRGQCVLNLISEEHRAAFAQLTARVFAGERGSLEFEITSLRGEQRFLETRAVPLREPDGAVAALLGITRDITARRDAERERAAILEREHAARREAEEERRKIVSLLERVSDGFVALNREWRYTFVNQKAAELLGLRREEILGQHIWTLFPEGVGQPFQRAYIEAMEERKFVFIEEDFLPWGRSFENRIYPTEDGIAIFFHEITERKVAERKINEQLEELRRWYRVTLGREERVRELKREVNELRGRLGEAPAYPSAADEDAPPRIAGL
jgi:PAS domain S-box-containing protein